MKRTTKEFLAACVMLTAIVASWMWVLGCSPAETQQAAQHAGEALDNRGLLCAAVKLAHQHAPGDAAMALAAEKCDSALTTVREIADALASDCAER